MAEDDEKERSGRKELNKWIECVLSSLAGQAGGVEEEEQEVEEEASAPT